jgi:catalase (peroxidase I)
MNTTLADFESFSNKYVSRTLTSYIEARSNALQLILFNSSYRWTGSDVIALATTFAVASCGGPILPFRGGRVDALTAGPMGVPQPFQDLQTHTELFSRQGFSQSEMITLVACGHTIGGVRSTDFPEIVPPEGDPAVATVVEFDTSDKFDNVV